MPHPPVRVRPQRLLADDRAPRQEQPGNASALTGVHDFDPDERLRAGPPSARFHQAPPPTRPGLPISAYTQAEECTTAVRHIRFPICRTAVDARISIWASSPGPCAALLTASDGT